MYFYNAQSFTQTWRVVYALGLGACISFVAIQAHAQTPKSLNTDALAKIALNSSAPVISGYTFDKKPFQLSSLNGKVVVVMFWSTDCAVCRDLMPELRENIRGWADKPFELVLVSLDKRMSDVDSYNSIVSQSVPVKQRFIQLWAGDPDYKDNLNLAQTPKNLLPLTLVIDKIGKVVDRNSGRIPAAWWDNISDLL
jgi:thiol-disulfide isomerase/thioredoxin